MWLPRSLWLYVLAGVIVRRLLPCSSETATRFFFPFLFWSTELSRFAAQTGISVRLLWLTGLYNEATHEYGD